ncbi:MAG: allantoate amidohydrolase, partial [Pseudomonadota bacterium]
MQRETNLAVNGDRLWSSLMEMARIGATKKGGVRRLALTDLDLDARDLFRSWCEAAGLTVSVDQMGNTFARRAGRDDTLPPVLVGSHLDSQPTGGKFDGALGVLSALELVRTLNDLGIATEHPIEVVNFTNEEGSRFAPAMVASGVMAGVFSLDYGLGRADADGITIGDELERLGLKGDMEMGGRPLKAFFEVHIEQGPVLEESDTPIGVVTHAHGQRWFEITFEGVESHAGPTPMDRRKDALVGAARLVNAVHDVGHTFMPDACATCGMIEVYPASRNVIPGRAWVTVDLRNKDDAQLAGMVEATRTAAAEISFGGGVIGSGDRAEAVVRGLQDARDHGLVVLDRQEERLVRRRR